MGSAVEAVGGVRTEETAIQNSFRVVIVVVVFIDISGAWRHVIEISGKQFGFISTPNSNPKNQRHHCPHATNHQKDKCHQEDSIIEPVFGRISGSD